jgi:SNF2 family DNA or RNA helicase
MESWWSERPTADGLERAALLDLRPLLEGAGSVRLDLPPPAEVPEPGEGPGAPLPEPWHSATPWAGGEPPDDEGPSLAQRLAVLLQPPLESWLAAAGVLDWPHPMHEYQRDGVRALLARRALLLADDMGLGKTVQALAALRILFHQRRAGSALLVVPAGLIPQWQRAAREWAPELRLATVHGAPADRAWQWQAPAHLYLTSYDTLRSDFTDNPASPPRRRVWGVVLLDEAQRIKNPDAEVSLVCKRLPRARAWALTGTPLENRLADLGSILEFLTPWRDGDPPPRAGTGLALLARHASLQLRRRKADVLPQLPPKRTVEVALRLGPAQRESYRRAEREGVVRLRGLGAAVQLSHVLELVTRLKQICNVCPATGESAKLADLEDRLETLTEEGHRALVFSQYVEEPFGVRALERALRRFAPVAYTGELSSAERDRAIATFAGEPDRRVLLLSLRAGGQGLNLQQASYVFHFDRWWNPAAERQAEDRAHRIGQESPVTVYKYLCTDTIEERIDAVLRSKQALFDEVVDDVSLDLERHLSPRELFGLFGLEPPATPPGRSAEGPG